MPVAPCPRPWPASLECSLFLVVPLKVGRFCLLWVQGGVDPELSFLFRLFALRPLAFPSSGGFGFSLLFFRILQGLRPGPDSRFSLSSAAGIGSPQFPGDPAFPQRTSRRAAPPFPPLRAASGSSLTQHGVCPRVPACLSPLQISSVADSRSLPTAVGAILEF